MRRAAPLLSAAAAAAAGNTTRHEITALPGLGSRALPMRMVNGFVDGGAAPGGGELRYHYWLAESEGDPAKDPVVFWYQGGPGASSLFGFLQELGPLLLNAASYDDAYNASGVPSLVRNAWSWTKVATVVAVDSPPPIGFSYCDPPGAAGSGTSCGDWSDTKAAAGSRAFLEGFFSAFPEYHANDVYITGESYGGVYVPMLVEQVLDRPVPGMRLKGFATIDGVLGASPKAGAGFFYELEFMHGHGQFSNALWYKIQEECPESELRKFVLAPKCYALVAEALEQVGGFYDYNLYDECPHSGAFLRAHRQRTRVGALGAGPAGTSSPCPLTALSDWLSLPAVLEALGLQKDAVFFNTDNGKGFNYKSDHAALLPSYEKAVAAGLRVLSMHGGTDPMTDGANQDAFVEWAAAQGYPQTQGWRPFTVDDKKHVAGHLMQWGSGNFTWLRVRGSGHMIPEYKPWAALTAITSFITGADYPRYHGLPGDSRMRLADRVAAH